MFKDTYIPWVLFMVGMYLTLDIAFMDVSNGRVITKIMWRIIPFFLVMAVILAWLLEMGFILAPG